MLTNPHGKYLPETHRNNAIVALARYDSGLRLADLATQFHISVARVSVILRAAGIRRKRGKKPLNPIAA